MADLKIDLDKEIAELTKRWNELKAVWTDPPSQDLVGRERQRREIIRYMDHINEKIMILESIRNNKAASEVVIREVTPQEEIELNQALGALHVVIQREQVFDVIIATATTILGAADTVISGAGKGQPAS